MARSVLRPRLRRCRCFAVYPWPAIPLTACRVCSRRREPDSASCLRLSVVDSVCSGSCSAFSFTSRRDGQAPVACRSGSTQPSLAGVVARSGAAGFHCRAAACFSCPCVDGPSSVGPCLTSCFPPKKSSSMPSTWKAPANALPHHLARTALHSLQKCDSARALPHHRAARAASCPR